MAEYIEIDGKQVRVRPVETVSEVDKYGNFHRQPNHFTKGFGEGENPVEKDRYILFWAKGCHWSNRASITRELLGLQDAIKVEIVGRPEVGYGRDLGWEFVNSPDHINKETGARFLSELYFNADPDYEGRATVPAFVDYTTGKVVNNDYHRLTNYLEVDFKPFHKKDAPDLYPEELREEIDKLNWWLFENVNNAVYRAQFAQSLQAFSDAYETFFAGLEAMDRRLADRRFLFGDYVTDSDIRLFVTLARFDVAYSRNIGPCLQRLVDYENLWPYARDLYQIPAFAHNTYFKDFAATRRGADKAKDYDFSTYYDLVIPETDFDAVWKTPTGREKLSKDPGHKFRLEKA
jgi:putative glutathione S-transferase